MNRKTIRLAGILICVILVIGIAMASTMIASVPTGYTGILTTMGKVEDGTYEAGIHIKSPFQNMVCMDNRVQKNDFVISAFSSDIQQVDATGSVSYSIDKATAVTLYKNVGVAYYDTLISPRLLETIKTVFARYTAEGLIGNRDRLSSEACTSLSAQLKDYGINILSVTVGNIDFTDAFTDAVEAKQVAEQTKLKAQTEQAQKTMEAQQEADRKKLEAENAAAIARINADAALYTARQDADAKRYAGEQEAEMNKSLTASLTNELIQYLYAQSWNGKLPQYVTGGNGITIPMLDLTGTDETTGQ